ncbi:hypothetical protein C1646_697764 [Rhizophagus diaphanus]|nr:hypothetical protein C1646_697764 [Rhizophagus diaphanus] [Rhizophagus sp. MUCL 43196]
MRVDTDIGATNAQQHVRVQIIKGSQSNHALVPLNLKDRLPKVREILKQNNEVKMNDTLSFANSSLAEIAREDEEIINLEKILVKNTLYLINPDYNFLKNELKLEYGRTTSLYKAKGRAFIVKDCEITEAVNQYKYKIKMEDQIIKKDLLLIADTNIARLGTSKIKKSRFVTNSTYNVIEFSKVSLKFKLEPTEEFIEIVNKVVESGYPRRFKKITEEFGQFISEEVILGGRAYFKKPNTLNILRNRNNYSKLKLVGGRKFNHEEFNESGWLKSLESFRNWDCIKVKDPISIFKPLPKELRKQILSLVGKKILYTSTEDYDYKLSELENPNIFELKNISEDILEIIRNKDADCNIFATVVKKGKNDIFNCQILWPLNEDPRIIIHCIQKKSRKHECKLKINLMIIGYDINFNCSDFNIQLKVQKHHFNASNCQKLLDLEYDLSVLCFGVPVLSKLNSSNNSLVIGHHFFNDKGKIGVYAFSYSLEKKHYVDIPDFTFYTLIISNYPNSSNYSGLLPFKHNKLVSGMVKSGSLKPKYVEICDQENCICKIKNNQNFVSKQDKNLKSYAKNLKISTNFHVRRFFSHCTSFLYLSD